MSLFRFPRSRSAEFRKECEHYFASISSVVRELNVPVTELHYFNESFYVLAMGGVDRQVSSGSLRSSD